MEPAPDDHSVNRRIDAESEPIRALRSELAEQRRIVEQLSRASLAIARESDLDRIIKRATDAAAALTGAERGVFEPSFRPPATLRCQDRVETPCELPPALETMRSALAIPVVSRQGEILGGLCLGHSHAGHFTGHHEQLGEAIAAQTALAIAAVRLTGQLTGHERALQEWLSRHSEVRNTISQAFANRDQLQHTLQRCCAAFVEQIGVSFARIWTLEPGSNTLELQASAGKYTHLDGAHARVPVGKFKIGLIAAEGEPHLTNDVRHDPRIGDPAWAEREGMVAFAGYPLRADGRINGVLAMFSQAPLGRDTLTAMAGVADVIAQGIERARAERALAAHAQELERSNAELERFAYVASHDLQEPLRMVASYTQLLQRRYADKLDAKAETFIRFAVDGATRMQQLINDLLAFSRVQTHAKERRCVSAEDALTTALGDLAIAIEDAQAIVVVDRPLPDVKSDPTQLAQLFQNLIGNAVKFRRAAPHIRVSAQLDGAMVRFAVHDDGIGIDPAYFDKIFVIFQRLHTREEHPGTGIGLALCKRIVERHGGRIWVESRPGQGSSFFFTLPRGDR